MKSRMLFGLCAALAVMAFAAASASAARTSPRGPFTGTASGWTMSVVDQANTTITWIVTCNTATLPGTVNADSSITGGTPTFSGCVSRWKSNSGTTSGEPAVVTVTEPVRWTQGPVPPNLRTTLQNVKLHVGLPSRYCGMNYNGTLVATNAGPFPVTVAQLAPAGTLNLTGFTKEPPVNSPFCEELYEAFREAKISATYTMNPALVVG
jgi:hypothetical protein